LTVDASAEIPKPPLPLPSLRSIEVHNSPLANPDGVAIYLSQLSLASDFELVNLGFDRDLSQRWREVDKLFRVLRVALAPQRGVLGLRT